MNTGRSVPSVSSTCRPLRSKIPLTIATCAGRVLPPGNNATRMRVTCCSAGCAVSSPQPVTRRATQATTLKSRRDHLPRRAIRSSPMLRALERYDSDGLRYTKIDSVTG